MLSLMIVDDSNIIRRKIERCNDSDKFRVVAAAANGVEALELFKQTRPQVVTMDLTMPEMDGIACIQQLMALEPDLRILVISALSDKATGIDALKKVPVVFYVNPLPMSNCWKHLLSLPRIKCHKKPCKYLLMV